MYVVVAVAVARRLSRTNREAALSSFCSLKSLAVPLALIHRTESSQGALPALRVANKYGSTPFHIAAVQGHSELCQWLDSTGVLKPEAFRKKKKKAVKANDKDEDSQDGSVSRGRSPKKSAGGGGKSASPNRGASPKRGASPSRKTRGANKN